MENFLACLSAGLEMAGGKDYGSLVYLAAVSGGADSTAMLLGMAELRRERGFGLYCVHVEHGIRPAEESEGDARAVEALCERLEIPFRLVSIKRGRIAALAGSGGPGIEGAARLFRMRALHREARRVHADWILTAHTKDDALETLLMRILNGSGPAGLSLLPGKKGRILRPLINLTRQEALEFLREKGVSYQTDSTNADIRFLRNRVRHKLVPLLDSQFPSWRNSLLALGETQSMTAEFLKSETEKRLHWEGEKDSKGRDISFRLEETVFFAEPPIVREEAIFSGADLLSSEIKGKSAAGFTGSASSLKRKAVRQAALRGAASLGPVQLEQRDGFIKMVPVLPPFPAAQKPARERGGRSSFYNREERGFSLVLNEPGLYTLDYSVLGMSGGKALRIHVSSPDPKMNDCEPRPNKKDAVQSEGFYAKLPLVLRNHKGRDYLSWKGHERRLSAILDRNARSGYTVITAEDTEGISAFVFLGRDGYFFVMGREESGVGTVDSGSFALPFIEMSLF